MPASKDLEDEDTTADDDASYQSYTVVELRDELTARNLPTSGHKDELVARLEEDDAAKASTSEEPAAPEPSRAIERAGEEAAPVDPYPPRKYSPYELPADPFAAQAFATANPDAVDQSVPMPEEVQTQATAAIQERADFHAAMGTPVSDPRLGGSGEIPDPSLTAIVPSEALVGPPEDVLLNVMGDNFLTTTQIGFGVFSEEEAEAGLGTAGEPKWERTTFVNGSTLTTVLSAGLHPSADPAVPVVIGEPGGTVSEPINFAFIEPEPPPEEES
jgi:SAP domain